MKRALLSSLSCSLSLALAAAIGCTPAQQNPDNIRRDTAKATAEAAKDAKAVVQGVADGIKASTSKAGTPSASGPLNINAASADQLDSLPGIDDVHAQRIIAGRPYASSDELVKRHLISKAEYDRISTQITAQESAHIPASRP
jgi:DNA uptake protein ComE-like DNA-binding protein